MHEHNLQDRIRVLGEDHPNTLASRNNLAKALLAVGNPDRAIDLFDRNHALCLQALGEEHPYTLASRENLEKARRAAGESDQPAHH